MTQQYLSGELSLLLGELQETAHGQATAQDVGCLRHEAETSPISELGSVAVRALVLTDGLCWDSLNRADTSLFAKQAAIGADLYELGVCSGLLEP